MANFIMDLSIQFAVVCLGYLMSLNMYYFLVPISIFGALIAIYFLIDKSKKKLDFTRHALSENMALLTHENKLNADELAELRVVLESTKKQNAEMAEENQALVAKNAELENQIKNLKMIEVDSKDEIIIEYYLNEKSGY